MDDLLDAFLNADTAGRLRMARDSRSRGVLIQYFGEPAYREYSKIASRLDECHLRTTHTPNLIFIPGVMGSMLQSRYKGGIWWIDARNRNKIDQLRLSPDGREDADPNNGIIPATTDPSYEPFLSAVLAEEAFGHELFPYDWRKPMSLSVSALRDLVLRLYDSYDQEPVHLVTHSMGGLLVRAALMAHGPELWPKLGQIVFIGTPHYGSPAIAGYLKNHLWGFDLMAVLGLLLSRQTYRSMWGVLELLPAPQLVYPGTRGNDPTLWMTETESDHYVHPCANFDLYRADQWDLDLASNETAALQAVLDGVAQFHRQMYDAHRALPQELRDRMLVIAGVGYQTLFRVAYEPQFFGLWEKMAKITSRRPGDPHREGDGRVPLASAALEDVPIRYVRGIHGGLTNIPQVYKEAFRWLRGDSLQLPDTPEGALSEHLAVEEGTSETPHLDGSVRAGPSGDDSGLWRLAEPDQQQLTELMDRLAADQMPEFNRVRLL
jgi:pimeloyl-ACP methyl ester carboxylesterase